MGRFFKLRGGVEGGRGVVLRSLVWGVGGVGGWGVWWGSRGWGLWGWGVGV